MSLASVLKENRVVWAGIILPLLLISLFAFTKTLPERLVPAPKYKLVYASQPWNDGRNYVFNINKDGKLAIEYRVPPSMQSTPSAYNQVPNDARLFVFNGADGQLEEIKLERPVITAKKEIYPISVERFSSHKLTDKSAAPDGYTYTDETYSHTALITEIFSYRNNRRGGGIEKSGRFIPLPKSSVGGQLTFIGWEIE